MRNLCLDEGTLQSYYDGQLGQEELERVSSHLASCAMCRETVCQLETEMDIANVAFAAELALSVPSERLRNRLDEAIAGLNAEPMLRDESATSRLRVWFASFASTFNISPQKAIAFASLLVFFVLAAIAGRIVIHQNDNQSETELVSDSNRVPSELPFVEGFTIADRSNKAEDVKLKYTKRRVRPIVSKSAGDNQVVAAHRLLPGEKNYLQAISLLTEAIEVNGETSLQPTLLADYKRNLEVVNQAISATQVTARTNPSSADAAEMLFAVYQSKLDLLSAVAEQSRPMVAQR